MFTVKKNYRCNKFFNIFTKKTRITARVRLQGRRTTAKYARTKNSTEHNRRSNGKISTQKTDRGGQYLHPFTLPLYTRKLTIPRTVEIKNTAARKTHGTPLF